jgi:hypothetical protein
MFFYYAKQEWKSLAVAEHRYVNCNTPHNTPWIIPVAKQRIKCTHTDVNDSS